MAKTKLTLGNNNKNKDYNIQDCGQIGVVCNQCNNNILVIQVTQDNKSLVLSGNKPIYTNIQVKCYCGAVKEQRIDGLFFFGAADDNTILELVDEQDILKVEVKKKCKN